jgi:hypothetical protein
MYVVKQTTTELEMLGIETQNTLISFATAWGSLGERVQEQVTLVADAHGTSEFEDVVCEQNPNALSLAFDCLARDLRKMEGIEHADDVLAALTAAMEMACIH